MNKKGGHASTNKIPAKKKKRKKYKGLYKDEPKHPQQELKLIVKLPPSQNHAFFTAKNGMRILKKEAKEYIKTHRQQIKEEIKKQGWTMEEGNVWYYLKLTYYFPDRRKRDWHNTLKVLLDMLEGLVYKNDYFVLIKDVSVKLDKNNPRLEIEVFPC